MPEPRQPHAPYPQPTDAFGDATPNGEHSARGGSPPPPGLSGTPVSTRLLLIPDDGTTATPPGPDAIDGPLSRSSTPQIKVP